MPQSRLPGVLKQPVSDEQSRPSWEYEQFAPPDQLLPNFSYQFPEHTLGSIPVHCPSKTLAHHDPDPGLLW